MIRWILGISLVMFLVPGCHEEDETKFEIGRAAKDHNLASLENALRSKNDDTRCYAAKAVSRIRNQEATTLYSKTLGMADCGWRVPAETAFRIEEVGARDLSPSLMRLLESEDERIRVSAARALAGLHWTHARSIIRDLSTTTENERAKGWYNWSLCRLAEPPPSQGPKQLQKKSTCKRPSALPAKP
jgi:HEAT repeat protein